MKIRPQTHPQLARLAELVEPMAVAMLTTRSPDDELTSRPMTPLEMDEAGHFWFFAARDSGVFDGRGSVATARPIGLGDHDRVTPPTDTSDAGPLGPFPAVA